MRRLRGRLAILGLGTLVAAASFAVLTASATATSPAKQNVRCVSGVALGRREYPCKTRMRLVCHTSPGQTVLQRIPSHAYYAGTWNIEFSPYHRWGTDGPPVKSGRLSIRTSRGVRREEAIVSLSSGAPPGTQVIIWVRCS